MRQATRVGTPRVDHRRSAANERGSGLALACTLALGSVVLAGCATRTAQLLPPPVSPALGDGAIHVALTWAAPVDLDLYVTDPSGEALYFGNNPTRAGARLEQDARCTSVSTGTPAIERCNVPTPAPGRYRIGVDFIDACGSGIDVVPFRVAVDGAGVHRDAQGTVRFSEFKIVVLEVEVGKDAPAGAE